MDWGAELRRILDVTVAGNELWRIAAFFAWILLFLILGKLAQLAAHNMARRVSGREQGESLGQVLLGVVNRTAPLFMLACGLAMALNVFVLSEKLLGWVASIRMVLVSSAFGFLFYQLVEVVDHALRRGSIHDHNAMDQMLVPLVRKSLRVTIVVMTLIQIAQSLSDKPITSILAGLGVGGLAVALAAQETIKNFFGSLVILADKPFALGNRIVVDQVDGTVEALGFRSTRIRTLEGHLVTIPNGELANKTIQNIGARPHIRRLMDVSLTYDTSPEKVAEAKAIILELLRNHEGMQPDFPPRVFFQELGSTALNLRVLYWYHPADFWAYSAFSETFNMELLRRFNAAGIAFAFPTQTVHLVQPEPPCSSPS